MYFRGYHVLNWICADIPACIHMYIYIYMFTSTPQLPFKRPQIPSNRDHKAVYRGTLRGLRTHIYIYHIPYTKSFFIHITLTPSYMERHLGLGAQSQQVGWILQMEVEGPRNPKARCSFMVWYANMCRYSYMYSCIYACMYIYIICSFVSVYMHICIHDHVFTFSHLHTCICICIYVNLYVCMYVCR